MCLNGPEWIFFCFNTEISVLSLKSGLANLAQSLLQREPIIIIAVTMRIIIMMSICSKHEVGGS